MTDPTAADGRTLSEARKPSPWARIENGIFSESGLPAHDPVAWAAAHPPRPASITVEPFTCWLREAVNLPYAPGHLAVVYCADGITTTAVIGSSDSFEAAWNLARAWAECSDGVVATPMDVMFRAPGVPGCLLPARPVVQDQETADLVGQWGVCRPGGRRPVTAPWRQHITTDRGHR